MWRRPDQNGSCACHTASCLLSVMPLLYPAVHVRIASASGAVCGNRLPRFLNSNPTKLVLHFSSHPQSYTHNDNCKTQILHGKQRRVLKICCEISATVEARFECILGQAGQINEDLAQLSANILVSFHKQNSTK